MSLRSLHGVANNFRSTLATGINSSTTTVDIDAPTVPYPALPFKLNVGTERLRVSAVAEDTPSTGLDRLTVTRAQDGTSAASHLAGASVRQYADAIDITELQTRVQALSALLAAMMGVPVTGSVSGVQATSSGTELKVQAQSSPDMTVKVKAGSGIVSGTPVALLADYTTAAITAPVSNPRIDIVQIDQLGNVTVKAGTEAGSPSAPAVDTDNMKLAEIALTVGMTTITAGAITDSRSFL
jgi:hypothetical protein